LFHNLFSVVLEKERMEVIEKIEMERMVRGRVNDLVVAVGRFL